jgi:tRNA threonylcarbamoyladenosine biosynthesis protein TsaB
VRVLAIETATVEVGVAVVGEGGPVATGSVRPGRRHAEALHPLVVEVMARAGLALGDLDVVAVDVGPGLFTGLRVGVAAAKALAAGLGIPVVPVRGLDALVVAGGGADVVPVIDLRRGELAWLPPGAGPSVAARRGEPEVLAAELAAWPGELLLVGDGALRYRGLLAPGAGAAGLARRVAGAWLAAPPAAVVGELATELAASGGGIDPAQVAPLYLRDADARPGWAVREPAREGVATVGDAMC